MKQRGPQGLPYRLYRALKKQPGRDKHRHYGNRAHIEADKRILEDLEGAGCGKMEYQPEMHSGYDHEEDDDVLNPPVAIVLKEWLIASKRLIPAAQSRRVSTTASER